MEGGAMKKVLILGRRNVGEKNDSILLAAAIARQAELDIVGAYYEDIVFVIDNQKTSAYLHGETRVELESFNTVVMINWSHSRIYTDVAHSIAYILARTKTKVWNSELLDVRSSTKVSQLVRLSFEDMKIPQTVFSLTVSHMREYMNEADTPFIAKDPLASRGRNNHLCRDWQMFNGIASEGIYYLLQQFIPNDQSDLRMFVVGGAPDLVLRRRGVENTHLNNISQGASSELVPLNELPAKLISDTVTIAQHFRRELCGIDFMKDTSTGEYVFLEINTTPQIVNGVYVEEKAKVMAKALER
jgi:glutathione synthase/RimK-type ligase-like ATP-grasp enzyme